MIELPKDKIVDGFNNTIVFETPNHVLNKLNDIFTPNGQPNIIILRNGTLKLSWENLSRQSLDLEISMTLISVSVKEWTMRTLSSNESLQKLKWLKGGTPQYVLSRWPIYTSMKYYKSYFEKISKNYVWN